MKDLKEELMLLLNTIDNLPYDIPKEIENDLDNAYNAINEAYIKIQNHEN